MCVYMESIIQKRILRYPTNYHKTRKLRAVVSEQLCEQI